MKVVLAYDLFRYRIFAADRRLDANPVRFALHGAVRAVRLFRVPRRIETVDHDGHAADIYTALAKITWFHYPADQLFESGKAADSLGGLV
ncbi:MAG: hypothetical protein WDM89_07720 [Rhizomicrobium sp.]